MATRTIRIVEDDVLRKRARKVEEVNDKIMVLIDDIVMRWII